jgi:hypothetical protein
MSTMTTIQELAKFDVARPYAAVEHCSVPTMMADLGDPGGLGSAAVEGASSGGNLPPVDPVAWDSTNKHHAPAKTRRAKGLFIVRESNEFNLELFNAMREQTYAAWPDLPDVQLVRALGMLPMQQRVIRLHTHEQGEVIVKPLRRGKTTAYLFRVGEYWHFWSMASAVKLNDKRINEVTALLTEVFAWLRPEAVYVHNISRLIRSRAQGGLLQASIEEHVDVVYAGKMPFHFRGELGQAGSMMFSMFASVASMERDWIVQRLLAGRVAKWRRSEWPFGKGSVPFGYKVDSKTKLLVVDESKVPAVREMLRILAFGVTPKQMQRDLDAAGVVGMKAHRRLGTRVPVGTMRNASGLINSLYAYASVWCRGEFLFRHVNVFKDLDHLAGVDVVRATDDESDMGELQMLYRLPVPEGGWGSPELLEAFAAAAQANARRLVDGGLTKMRPLSPTVELESVDPFLLGIVLTGERMRGTDLEARRRATSRAKKFIAPLAGRGWRDGDWWYELLVGGARTYKLVRWPLREEHVRDRSGVTSHDDTSHGVPGGEA